jgi:GPH family glycoside/pentoside/hexuronide:cation symporter
MAQEVAQGIVTERIKLREKLSYGLGDVASVVVWGGVGSFATFYYTNSAGMAAAAIGTMFLISRIFDGISDVIMGLIIDRTRSRFGKARPWLLWMAVPFGAAAVLLFSVPQGWGPGAKLIYAYITYNLLSTVVYTAINLSYGTMTALITDDSRDRTLLNIFRVVGAVFSGIVVNMVVMPMVGGFGGGPDAWGKTFGALGSVAVVLFLFCFLGTKERVGASAKKENVAPVKVAIKALLKNKYWFLLLCVCITGNISTGANTGMSVYFAKYWLNNENLVGILALTYALPLLVGLLLVSPLVAKFGKRNMMLVGSTIVIVGTVIQFLQPGSMVIIMVGNIFRGLGLAPGAAVLYVMIADAIDYGEWKTGIRTDGLIYSASSFGIKVGTGLGAASVGWALALGGFDAAAAVQSRSTMTAILVVFICLPIVLSSLAMLVMWQYKLDKEIPHILADLKERHQADQTSKKA